MEGRGDEREWKFLANNGNGERIQIEIAPCGRLLGRGTKLGQTTWMLFSSSRDFFSSQRERAGSQNKAFVKVMSRNSFEQISRSETMSLLCMFPRLLFLLLLVPVLCAFSSSQRRQSSSANSIDNVCSAFQHHCKKRLDKDSFVAKITIELLRLIRIKKVSLKNAAYVLYRLREKPRNNVEHERFFQSIRRRITFFSRELVFAIRNYRSLGLVRNIRERERDWW